MRFEHFALNVPDSRAMADWYVQHLGMRVVRRLAEAPWTHFLADSHGQVVMEIYANPKAEIPDFAARHPLCFHFAFEVSDPDALREKLLAEGATLFADERMPDGSRLIMLRDPWGVPLQLCRRARSLFAHE